MALCHRIFIVLFGLPFRHNIGEMNHPVHLHGEVRDEGIVGNLEHERVPYRAVERVEQHLFDDRGGEVIYTHIRSHALDTCSQGQPGRPTAVG